MMRRTLSLAVGLMISASAAFASDAPGLSEFQIDGPRPTEAHLMYPTASDGPTTGFGGNKVWQATDVQFDAPIDGADLPLVVMSHGMYGNRYNQVWLARELVKAGYAVVALNHPGTSSFSRERALSRQHWERPADLGRAIDAVLANPDWAAAIDDRSIFAIGHSLGGHAVLAAAGARFDADQMAAFCADARAIACNAFEVLGLSVDDREALGADLTEPRLKGIVSLDPGGTFGFTDASLAALNLPTLLISAGRTPEQLNAVIESDRVAELVLAEVMTYLPMPEAGHFDFLGTCTEGGLDILKAYEPDDVYVCESGRDARTAIHQQAATAILGFLDQHR